MIIWNATNDLTCGNVTYHVTYHVKFTTNETITTEDTTMDKTYTINDLTQDGDYTIFVYGANEAGDGQANNISIVLDICTVKIPNVTSDIPYPPSEGEFIK